MSSAVITVFARYFLPDILNDVFGRNSYFYSVYEYNSILTFTSSLFLFLFLININIRKTKVNSVLINISKMIFCVYLLIDWPMTRSFVWKRVFNVTGHLHSATFLPYTVGIILLVCLAGLSFELLRSALFSAIFKVDEESGCPI